MRLPTRLALAVAFVVVACGICAGQTGTSSSALSPAGGWWQKPQVVMNDAVPNLDDLGTVIGWGWTPDPHLDPVLTRKQIDDAHRLGRRYVMAMNLLYTSYETYQARPDLADLAIIDIDGNRMAQPDIAGRPIWWCNLNLPAWQDFLIERIKAVVDYGADGVIIDGNDGMSAPMSHGGSFAAEDMALFRSYLASRYTAEQLSSNFGITDITTFDYGQYIHSNGLLATWKANPWAVPLAGQYQDMEFAQTFSLLRRMADTARDYARTKYGRYFTFTVNAWAMAGTLLPETPPLDYFTVEFPFSEFGYAPRETPVAALKLARALGNRGGWILPSIYTVGEWKTRVAANKPVDNLMKIYTSQAYAAHGAFWVPYDIWGYTPTGNVRLDLDPVPLRPYYSTAKEFSAFLTQRGSLAKVALLYSQASERYRWDAYRFSYLGTAHALLNARVLYDVVPLGSIGVSESPGPAALAPYRAAYLPSAACLSQTQIDDILAWVSHGGTLIVFGFGEFGTCTLLNDPASFPALDPYRSPGTRTRGAGRIVTLASDVGTTYRNSQTAENLAQVVTPLQGIEQPLTALAPTTLNVLADTSMSGGAVVIHLVNTDWTSETDAVAPVGSATVRCLLPQALQSAPDLQAYRVSPDRAAPERLSFVRDGSFASVTSTAITFWDLVIFTTDARARSFASGPIGQFTSLLASLTAKGRDASAFLPIRDAINAATSAGNHLQAEHLAHGALPDLTVANRYRVLFAEAHHERVTISPSRKEDTPYVTAYSAAMVPALATEFSIERSESPLTPSLLAPYDALMVVSPDRRPDAPDYGDVLSATELQAVQQFVSAGRGLLVLGDCSIDASVNNLLAGTGISFPLNNVPVPWKRTACVLEKTAPTNGNFLVTDITPHDATHLVSSFFTTTGTSLTVTSPAVALARTSANTFADTIINPSDSNQFVFNASEPGGPLPVVAVSTFGAGRVYVWGDNAVLDTDFNYRTMTAMMRAALRWVVRSQAGDGLDVTAPAITITQPADRSVTSAPTANLTGTASDASGIAQVSWSTDAGAAGTAVGTTAWASGAVPLRVGDNVVTVTAADAFGNLFGASRTLTRTAALVFTDSPLVAGTTPIRAAHVVELRLAIDELRVRHALTRYPWTDAAVMSGATQPKALHVTELRTALAEVYVRMTPPRTPPVYLEPVLLPGVTVVRAAHINELRAAVAAIW